MSRSDAVDLAYARLCMAVIKSAKQDLGSPRYRGSAREFFWGDDSHYAMYLDYLLIEYPGVRLGCVSFDGKEKGRV